MNLENYSYDALDTVGAFILKHLMPQAGMQGNNGAVYFLNDTYLAIEKELESRELYAEEDEDE